MLKVQWQDSHRTAHGFSDPKISSEEIRCDRVRVEGNTLIFEANRGGVPTPVLVIPAAKLVDAVEVRSA